MDVQSFIYSFPFPLTEAHLLEVATVVVSSIAVDDTLRLHYFLSSLFLLQKHSVSTQLLGRNVTLIVTNYLPSPADNEELWRKENAWVKIKVQGGTAPRANFIATGLGVASVNWKKTERSLLGSFSAGQGSEIITQFRSGTLFRTQNQPEAEGEKSLRRGNSLERLSLASAIFGDVVMMTAAAASRLLSDPSKLREIGLQLFDIFDEDKSELIDRKEFIRFFSKFLLQPLEVTQMVFEQMAGEKSGIDKELFINILAIFLQSWIQEDAEKQRTFIWTNIISALVSLSSEGRTTFISNEKALEELTMLLFARVNASDRSLNYSEFAELQCRFDRSIFNIPKSEEELREVFATFAVDGSVTPKQYVKFLRTAILEIYQFCDNWIQMQKFDEEYRVMDLETLREWIGNPEKLREYYSRMFQAFGASQKITGKQLAAMNRSAELPETIVPGYGAIELTVEFAIDYSVAETKKTIEEDLEHPGKSRFTKIAALNTERLMMLSLEEYRLKAIAHSLFTSIHPYREKHDLETFTQYAMTICELFQIEHAQEYLTLLFQQFSEESQVGDLLSEDEFVLCLKQMIGQQMKWAKSRDFQEGMKKQQVLAILSNPEATRALAKDLFDQADLDHDGWLSRAELKSALQGLVGNDSMIKFEGTVDELYDQLDTDHDGKLNLDEYQVFIVKSMKEYANS